MEGEVEMGKKVGIFVEGENEGSIFVWEGWTEGKFVFGHNVGKWAFVGLKDGKEVVCTGS